MSAECGKHGTDIVYPEGTWPVGVCPACERDAIEGERNHAFAFLRLILEAPYEPLPPGVLDAMRELVKK